MSFEGIRNENGDFEQLIWLKYFIFSSASEFESFNSVSDLFPGDAISFSQLGLHLKFGTTENIKETLFEATERH